MRVGHESKNFRQALIDVYTDQAMDNLVRARCNMPFVQLAYRDLLIQETDLASLQGSGGNTLGDTNGLTTGTSAALALGHSISSVWSIGGTAQRQGLMSLYATPVTDQNEIYDEYLAFARDENLLKCSNKKPDGPVHLMAKYSGRYFWIPCEAAPKFLDLVMKTTLQRGKETDEPAYYKMVIMNTIVWDTVPGKVKDAPTIYVDVFFDKSIRNGFGKAYISLKDGRNIELELQRVDATDHEMNPPRAGEPTDHLQAYWSPTLRGFDAQALIGCTARVYSNDYPRSENSTATFQRQSLDIQDRNRANNSILKP